MLHKSWSHHEDEINRVISYQEGVYLYRHVYNWWKYILLALTSITADVLSMIVAYIFNNLMGIYTNMLPLINLLVRSAISRQWGSFWYF